MGVSLSTATGYGTDYLYHEIRRYIDDLIHDYKTWSNKSICDQLEVVYYNKLIKFDTDELLDVSAAIGYNYKKDYDKKKLCEVIITHYKKRVELLQRIDDAIKRGRKRLYRAEHGPVCKRVDTFIDDFFICEQLPDSVWIDQAQYMQIINSYKKRGLYEDWIQYIEQLDKYYTKSIKQLFYLVKKIKKSINYAITDSELDYFESKINNTIKFMDTICDIYYILAVNYS